MAATAGRLIGIDGYRGGWVGAAWFDGRLEWRTARVGSFSDLIADAEWACVDMPVGLTDRGWRACDVRAKELLGTARSRVFMTPPRAVVDLGLSAPNVDAQRLARELTGQGVSRQALALSSRILDVDSCLPDSRILEVHPELSFQRMSGRVLPSKKEARGIACRIESLLSSMTDVDTLAALQCAPPDAPIDDCLDALAALWTARRHAQGQSTAILEDPDIDARGTAMQMAI